MTEQTATAERDNSDEVARPSGSQRDPETLREDLAAWLAAQLPADAALSVDHVELPSANGMSSETILADAQWTENGQREAHRLVIRTAPQPDSSPVFQHYDMRRQFDVMRLLGEHTTAVVPPVLWYCDDTSVLGGEFFVMKRVDGDVPPDRMPYTFGSWVTEASEADRSKMERLTVDQIARVHSAPVEEFAFLDDARDSENGLDAHVRRTQEFYAWVRGNAGPGTTIPLIDRGFEWLRKNWPTESLRAKDAVSWGDSRPGNVIYQDFEPVALLDWEMATIGPRELDLGWIIFLHRFFQDLTEVATLPGLPDFCRREDIIAEYAALTGHHAADMDFYTAYAALQHAVIMVRIQMRAIAFGQAQMPDDPDDLILHRPALQKMLDGTYWSQLASGASA
ncbi:phosphotransferase family protein [Mycobacterium sp. CBMA271]|uniref:phosphotransferase family protein n=1 Tax=unclassified Mycobacteroides TaxID=2618759 RepID=UPI0012DBF5EA|nr:MULTISPECIES: phosphotransferase family protein [unclassified Mycobacteroides]MUM19084.1 aminoglycoside phosphotransferase [Mycobacteroides sp. CBMA 326]MUM21497.1 phosphotransferase family protein [Mycobacteroides sp. CBMA 271]